MPLPDAAIYQTAVQLLIVLHNSIELHILLEAHKIIWTNFNYTYPRTICVQYLRILLSIFGEDFQKFAFSLLRSNSLWLLIGQ